MSSSLNQFQLNGKINPLNVSLMLNPVGRQKEIKDNKNNILITILKSWPNTCFTNLKFINSVS